MGKGEFRGGGCSGGEWSGEFRGVVESGVGNSEVVNTMQLQYNTTVTAATSSNTI